MNLNIDQMIEMETTIINLEQENKRLKMLIDELKRQNEELELKLSNFMSIG
jgi:hypothetical protein